MATPKLTHKLGYEQRGAAVVVGPCASLVWRGLTPPAALFCLNAHFGQWWKPDPRIIVRASATEIGVMKVRSNGIVFTIYEIRASKRKLKLTPRLKTTYTSPFTSNIRR